MLQCIGWSSALVRHAAVSQLQCITAGAGTFCSQDGGCLLLAGRLRSSWAADGDVCRGVGGLHLWLILSN